ncbi:hypothetical protein KM043_012152 [Ampulex compressa]|nr:hypothetical protein KM043_012152 [Ampulex compressa]
MFPNFDLLSVAAPGLSGGIHAGGSMYLHVEGGTQVQVPRSLMQAFLQQDPNHPGLETVRLPTSPCGSDEAGPTQHCRELETELCLVCRRCGRAYPQESSLLAHQRSCYLGNQQRRGALRLVQSRYACTLCEPGSPTRSYASLAEWRRHADAAQHRARLEASGQERQIHQFCPVGAIGPDTGAQAGEEANPLTDEMEDVVNQITLLAARAAAESTTGGQGGQSQGQGQGQGQGQDNNNGPEAKRQKLVQEVAALAGAR